MARAAAGTGGAPGGFMAQVVENHRHNFLICHEEDLARRDDLPAECIREAQRTIDRHNQLRNDAIETMDAALGAPCVPPAADAPAHSESPGMMLDGLSILPLREYHLEEESTRPDSNPALSSAPQRRRTRALTESSGAALSAMLP